MKRLLTIKTYLPGIAWFFVVALLLFMPGSGLPKSESWFEKIYGDKLIHAGIFAVLGFLFFLPVMNRKPIKVNKYLQWIGLAGCLWGITSEFIQKYYVPSRSFDLWDWFADTCGIVIGYFLAKILHGRVNRVK